MAKAKFERIQPHALGVALVGAFLTREITPEQINAKATAPNGRALERFGEVRSVDKDNRTIELAFSSEAPVARWFGEEVLDHTDGAMRAERLESGAALLMNHDWDDQVGVVQSVSIGSDRRGRAVVRFGRSARAEEIFADVVDGIRKHVSVGYAVRKIEVEPRKGQPDLVRVTEWEPYEISLVSVPADPTVGVGRQLEIAPEDAAPGTGDIDPTTGAQVADGKRDNKDRNMEKTLRDAQGNLVRAKVDADGKIVEVLEMIERAGEGDAAAVRRGQEAEQSRVRSIMEIGTNARAMDLANQFVRDGKSVEDFKTELLRTMGQKRGGSVEDGTADIGMTDGEVRQYSFMRALRALAAPGDRAAQEAAAFEIEASQAVAQRSGRSPQGLLVPADVLMRAMVPGNGQRAPLNTSTTGTNPGDTGGYSVATDLLSQSFVEMLRNRTIAMQLGRSMGGLVGNIDIPRQAAGASGYWIGEDDEATLTGLELDQISLSPKTVAAMSEITRRLLMQSSLDMEALVRRDLAAALATTIDKAFFYGSGSANQPRGVVNYTGINAVPFAGSAPTYAELVQMESEIAADNADVSSMAYVMNARARGLAKTTSKFAGGTDQGTIWEAGNTVNGYRAEITNQIEGSDVIFGNFADALIGMWGGLDLTIDPYTHSARGRLRIVAMQDVDFVLRRVESFALGRPAAGGQ